MQIVVMVADVMGSGEVGQGSEAGSSGVGLERWIYHYQKFERRSILRECKSLKLSGLLDILNF